MTELFDRDQRLPVPCNCGYEFQETIRRLEQNPKLTCPRCGTIINVEADQLAATMRDAERQIQSAFDSIPKEIVIKF